MHRKIRFMTVTLSLLLHCTIAQEVTALEFESHGDFKTSHPNNHIHLENGKSLHQVVQELKSTARSMLCDAIQTVIGASLNREAFASWKGRIFRDILPVISKFSYSTFLILSFPPPVISASFEAASEKWKTLDEYEINTQDNSPMQHRAFLPC